MFVRVDVTGKEPVDGYSYKNIYDSEEKVTLMESYVDIEDSDGSSVIIYYEDIPKLIKALEAAYKHNKGE